MHSQTDNLWWKPITTLVGWLVLALFIAFAVEWVGIQNSIVLTIAHGVKAFVLGFLYFILIAVRMLFELGVIVFSAAADWVRSYAEWLPVMPPI